MKYGEIIKFLKDRHEFTHGFANLVAHRVNGSNVGSAENLNELVLNPISR